MLKIINKIAFAGLLVMVSHVWAHGNEEGRVALEPESTSSVDAGTITYKFQLVDTNKKKTIETKDLKISHEKLLHLVVYDPGLKEFQHVHPTFDGTDWLVDLKFSVNGNYFVWAQGTLAVDGYEFSAGNRLVVKNGKPNSPAPTLGDLRKNSDGVSQVELSNGKIAAGQMVMLDLKISHTDGTKPQLSPYLGAFAHVIAVPADGDSLIHVHPMAGNKPNEGMLHATFPESGDYRIWVQFMDNNEVKTVPLSVRVGK